jgi:acetyl-CoA carboxylase carboxyl transferase subunit beta
MNTPEMLASLWVCNSCGYHLQVGSMDRIEMLVEEGSFTEWEASMKSVDILGFEGAESYQKKLEENRKKTSTIGAVTCGKGDIGSHAVGLAVMDFQFLGASMGSVVGEKISRLIERSTKDKMPVIIVCASGGARMYEGMFSLMQMAKTSGAVSRHAAAGLPYITVLTHPTMAGVMASFATQGDVIIAEPNALIGFAGPRVIKETTQAELPAGFQTAEFLLDHGLIDRVVERKDLKDNIISILDYLRPDE